MIIVSDCFMKASLKRVVQIVQPASGLIILLNSRRLKPTSIHVLPFRARKNYILFVSNYVKKYKDNIFWRIGILNTPACARLFQVKRCAYKIVVTGESFFRWVCNNSCVSWFQFAFHKNPVHFSNSRITFPGNR